MLLHYRLIRQQVFRVHSVQLSVQQALHCAGSKFPDVPSEGLHGRSRFPASCNGKKRLLRCTARMFAKLFHVRRQMTVVLVMQGGTHEYVLVLGGYGNSMSDIRRIPDDGDEVKDQVKTEPTRRCFYQRGASVICTPAVEEDSVLHALLHLKVFFSACCFD